MAPPEGPVDPTRRAFFPPGASNGQPPPPGGCGFAAAAAKRVAETPLDQMPYQRKYSFRRKAHVDLEEQAREFMAHHAAPECRFRAVLGRVVGPTTGRDVVLPVRSEVLLERGPPGRQDAFAFAPALPPALARALEAALEAQAKGPGARRWANVAVEAREGAAGPSEATARETFYCPGGQAWHYELQADCPSAALSTPAATGGLRREVSYRWIKEQRATSIWWAVTICGEGEKRSVELTTNPQLLHDQCCRMFAGKAHAFSLVARDFLRNARALTALLGQLAQAQASHPAAREPATPQVQASHPAAEEPREEEGEELYFPGVFEPHARVREFYDQKARDHCLQGPTTPGLGAGRAPGPSWSENIRRYNNLAKVLLIEQFVDTLLEPVRVLDLGCGNGQDINKYSRQFRGPKLHTYVGVDFAAEAVDEAERRHLNLVARSNAPSGAGEYAAKFIAGDLLSPATFDKIEASHREFDVVSLQFVMQYLADSEQGLRSLLERLHRLLRPGGRLLGCVPNCEALEALHTEACAQAGAGGEAMPVGNKLYSVRFRGELGQAVAAAGAAGGAEGSGLDEEAFATQWGLSYSFSLVDAVQDQQEYVLPWQAFEELAENVGFTVVLDATFPELLEAYKDDSPFYQNIFLSAKGHRELDADEDKLFSLYSGFVLERSGPGPVAEGDAPRTAA